jgi:hypothetical protein
MVRRAELVASFAALVLFAACGPTSNHSTDPDADPNAPDARPPCDFSQDADGDTIADCDDGVGDFDSDGTANNNDTDSDGDGYSDTQEAGDTDIMTLPQDTDGDGRPNFLDLDSDADGLQDADELAAGTDPTLSDTDGDGFSDLVEVTIHELCVMNPSECNGDPDPLDPNSGVSDLDYFFILPYMNPEQRKPLDFATDIGIADIHFSMDTTGSMGEEIANLRTSLSSIIASINDPSTGVPNTAFGVSRYDDFPTGSYGTAGLDLPFLLHQRVTTNAALAQAAVGALDTHDGFDVNESGWEALYRIATGGALSWNTGSIAAWDPNVGYDPLTNGLIGGVGFRAGALPIVVQITDARNHDTAPVPAPSCGAEVYGADVNAHSKSTAIAALQAIGVRVIGITSDAFETSIPCYYPRPDYVEAATATGARVPPAAFDLGGRPPGCAANQCCTDVNGAGMPTDADGLCPLVFDTTAQGLGLGNQVISGIRALVNFAVLDISAIKDSVPQPNAHGGTTNPGDFITDIVPITLTPLPPSGVVLDGTGHIFLDVQPGTTATFDVRAANTILMPAADPQVFTLKIRVMGDGLTLLSTRQVVIIVPPQGTIIE